MNSEEASVKVIEESPRSQKKVFEGKKATEYLGELKVELAKVDWTSRAEIVLYTKIVIASIFIFGMLVYLVDLAMQGALSAIHNIVRIILG